MYFTEQDILEANNFPNLPHSYQDAIQDIDNLDLELEERKNVEANSYAVNM